MFKDSTYQKEFSFPCNKCGGVVVAEHDIDYRWDDKGMYLDKIYCLECKRIRHFQRRYSIPLKY